MSELPERIETQIERELFGTRPPPRARFYTHGARNEAACMEHGYPVYEDRVYIEIKIPDSTDFVSHPATPAEIRQFPEAYAAFQRASAWKQHSLELLPKATPALLATGRALGLFTIEQLAGHEPSTAPWTLLEEGDRFPALNGCLPPAMRELWEDAKRFVTFYNKPRVRLVNGKLEEPLHV